MKQFRDNFKADSETMQRLNTISQEYHKNGRKMDFRNKVASAIYMAILDIETENEAEEAEKFEFMNNFNKIISDYDYFKPLISKHIEEQKKINIMDK